MPTTERTDPFSRFNFLLEIAGITQDSIVAGFSEVSGLANEPEVIEYREGNERMNSPRKIPGLTRYSNIVLKRGLTTDNSLWNWRKNLIDGLVDRRSGSIILLDPSRKEVLRWNFYNAWPCKWEGPVLKAKSGEVAIETLEIAYEGFELA